LFFVDDYANGDVNVNQDSADCSRFSSVVTTRACSYSARPKRLGRGARGAE